MSTRPAAVAGLFYDANPDRLRHDISQLLAAKADESVVSPGALIVPHAGYVYSGSTAASAYKCLLTDPGRVKRVGLIGPAHRMHVDGMAIPSVDYFATPLGNIALDRDALDKIGSLPDVQVLDQAHRQEHCLEVQLPFLQMVLHEFTLVPVLVGGASPASVAAVVDRLAGDEHTLIVISSDLSHFLTYEEARQIDTQTCESILHRSTSLRGEQACGAAAINGLMASRCGSGLQVTLLQACNSGDTAGQRDRVVGYAAFALH